MVRRSDLQAPGEYLPLAGPVKPCHPAPSPGSAARRTGVPARDLGMGSTWEMSDVRPAVVRVSDGVSGRVWPVCREGLAGVPGRPFPGVGGSVPRLFPLGPAGGCLGGAWPRVPAGGVGQGSCQALRDGPAARECPCHRRRGARAAGRRRTWAAPGGSRRRWQLQAVSWVSPVGTIGASPAVPLYRNGATPNKVCGQGQGTVHAVRFVNLEGERYG